MRFPWLQVGADVISAKAGDLGVLLGCSRREAMGLLVDLWAWVLTRSPDDVPPDGIVRDSRTGTGAVPATERAVFWAGPEGMLVTALEELGFVERLPDGLRFRGAERYAATWEKNRRRKQTGGKPERNRSGTGGEPARKTQTQTQTQIEKKTPEPAASGAPAEPLVLELQDAEDEARKRAERVRDSEAQAQRRALREAMAGVYRAKTGQEYVPAKPQADNAQAVWLLEQADAAEVLRRWGNLLDWSLSSPNGYPTVRGLYDLRQHWATVQVATAPPMRRASGAPAIPSSDFDTSPID